jgi:hypothetical protein
MRLDGLTRGAAVQAARDSARKRDDYTCQITGRGRHTGDEVHGAHLFPVNSPFPLYDPTDPRFVVTLLWKKHKEMDNIKNHVKRAQWLRNHGLHYYANLILETIGEDNGGEAA